MHAFGQEVQVRRRDVQAGTRPRHG